MEKQYLYGVLVTYLLISSVLAERSLSSMSSVED